MSKAAAERAEEVAKLPHVQKWVKAMKKLALEMPPEVWVYVASGTPHIMAHDENGRPMENPGGRDGMDSEASIATLDRTNGRWDGGDW